MEINTVPRFDAKDAQGRVYAKMPKLQFPVDAAENPFGAGRHLFLESGTLQRVPGMAGRRVGLLRAIRREGRLEAGSTTHTTRLRSGWQENQSALNGSSTQKYSRATSGACSGSRTPSALKVCSRSISNRRVTNAWRSRPRRCPPETRCFPGSSSLVRRNPTPRLARAPGPAGAKTWTVHRQARRRLPCHVLVVPVCRSALVPAICLECGEKGSLAVLGRRRSMRPGRPTGITWRLPPRKAGGTRSGLARDAAPRPGGGLRPHRHPPIICRAPPVNGAVRPAVLPLLLCSV